MRTRTGVATHTSGCTGKWATRGPTATRGHGQPVRCGVGGGGWRAGVRGGGWGAGGERADLMGLGEALALPPGEEREPPETERPFIIAPIEPAEGGEGV